jgi:hypothetical protein
LQPGASTTYEFDIPSRGVETTYAVFLESRGKRALLEGSTIAPNIAHVKSQVPPQRLQSVAQQLSIVNFRVTVSVVTDLGNASAALTLLQH